MSTESVMDCLMAILIGKKVMKGVDRVAYAIPFSLTMGASPDTLYISGVIDKDAINRSGFNAAKAVIETAARQLYDKLDGPEYEKADPRSEQSR